MEDDLNAGDANFSLDGVDTFVDGSASGILVPGAYTFRLETSIIDVDGDAQGDARFSGGFSLNLSAVSVPIPASGLLLFLIGLAGLSFKRSRA